MFAKNPKPLDPAVLERRSGHFVAPSGLASGTRQNSWRSRFLGALQPCGKAAIHTLRKINVVARVNLFSVNHAALLVDLSSPKSWTNSKFPTIEYAYHPLGQRHIRLLSLKDESKYCTYTLRRCYLFHAVEQFHSHTAEVANGKFGTLTAIDRRSMSPRMLPAPSHSFFRTVLLVTFGFTLSIIQRDSSPKKAC